MTKISKTFYNEKKDKLIDIIIFGSFVKNKPDFKDIDISLITKSGIEESAKLSLKFEKLLTSKYHVVYHIIDDLFSKEEPIWLSMLHEGYSLIRCKKISTSLGLAAKVLFTYKSSVLKYNDQIRFYYALKGRDGKGGILKDTAAEQVSKGVLIANIEEENELVTFFMNWNMPFTKKRIFIN